MLAPVRAGQKTMASLREPFDVASRRDAHRPGGETPLASGARGTRKSPARFPARAHYVSFNFVSNVIRDIESMPLAPDKVVDGLPRWIVSLRSTIEPGKDRRSFPMCESESAEAIYALSLSHSLSIQAGISSGPTGRTRRVSIS
jgi:hypothetical protein